MVINNMVNNTSTHHQLSNKFSKHLLLSLLILLTLNLMAFDALAKAANITVTTSRNPVSLDESFQLIYSVNSGFFSSAVDGDPDFSPIDKDFEILSSSQSMNSSYINGTWKQTKSWKLMVIAKDVGTFTIPPVHFGKDISPAIQITVSNATSSGATSPKNQSTVPAKIFLETEMDKKTGWVQSQFIYTVRLMRTVSISNASLSDPVSTDADAIIKKISEDNYQKIRNGVSYEVFERRYAIFPQKSGELKINPLTFEGRVNATQPRTIFDQFRMSGQLKRLRSRAVAFTVKPAPENINLQDWLPASNVQLQEQWSSDINNLKAGEPVTRTIIISAEGLTGIQLPELAFDKINGVKQYPDKAIVEDRKNGNGITGLKQIKIALIPGDAGSYTLPEIKLLWWNTRTNQKEIATLPPQVLTVSGSVASNNVIPEPPLLPQTNTTALPETGSTDNRPVNLQGSAQPYWKWLAVFFALAWLLTLMLYIKKPSASAIAKTENTKTTSSLLKKATATVKQHLKDNHAANTKNALIAWAKLFYSDNNISNLSMITAYCSTPLGDQIKQLNQALYNPEKPEWSNKDLLQAFNEEPLYQQQKDGQTSVLKPLYKL